MIAGTLAVRILFAAALGLGIDESYMVAAGRVIRLGYFDHPPISWWLAWAATQIGGSDAALTVRLPFILLFALSTWLLYRVTSELFGARAGFWAAVLLNAVPVLGITAGSWVLPDGPLITATLAAVFCFVRALRSEGRAAWIAWLCMGACCGLALCSKYTAVLTIAGLGVYLLTEPQGRSWLARPHPYVSMLLAFAVFSPVLVWNADNGWASLLFQGGRAAGGRWHPLGPVATLTGEALFFLPWIFLPLMACFWRALRRGPQDHRRWLLTCLATPSLLLFALVSLRNHVMFHWAAPGLMMGLPLLADRIARVHQPSKAIRLAVILTVTTIGTGLALVTTEVHFNWLPAFLEDFSPASDPDMDAVDWTTLREQLPERTRWQPGLVVAGTNWRDAGKIDYAMEGKTPIICLGNDPREYGLFAPAAAYEGADVVVVVPRKSSAWILAHFAAEFDQMEPLAPVVLLHAGRPSLTLSLAIGHRLHIQRSALQAAK